MRYDRWIINIEYKDRKFHSITQVKGCEVITESIKTSLINKSNTNSKHQSINYNSQHLPSQTAIPNPFTILISLSFLATQYIMQSLLQQNQRLKQIMFKCEQQIHQLQKIGQDHQQQIDNLLKFNQRLLSIIESQMPNKAVSRKSSGSGLQPIDEINEKDENVLMQHHFSSHENHMQDKGEHGYNEEGEKMSEDNQQDYKKHVNMPRSTNQRNNYPSALSGLRLNTTQSQSLNQTQNKSTDQNIIYRQQKQSIIDMPKYLNLQKGMNQRYDKEGMNQQYGKEMQHSLEEEMKNQRYNKQMEHSLEEMKNYGEGFTLPRLYTNISKLSQQIARFNEDIYDESQIIQHQNPIIIQQQQLAESFTNIHHLIQEYKQDFNTEEYLHLCFIIKNDLENDLQELITISQEKMRFYSVKEKEIMKLRQSLAQFSPTQKLLEIMKKLKISQETEEMIVSKVRPRIQSRNNGMVKQGR